MQFLFNFFMMLYVSSAVSDPIQAQTIIQQVNVVSVIATCLVVIPAGKLVDRVSSRISIPIAFGLSSLTLLSFQFLENPETQ